MAELLNMADRMGVREQGELMLTPALGEAVAAGALDLIWAGSIPSERISAIRVLAQIVSSGRADRDEVRSLRELAPALCWTLRQKANPERLEVAWEAMVAAEFVIAALQAAEA